MARSAGNCRPSLPRRHGRCGTAAKPGAIPAPGRNRDGGHDCFRHGHPCGNCDACLDPVQQWDATEAARKALACVYRTGQRFGALHVIAVLRGEATSRVSNWQHDELSTFGIGRDIDADRWRSIFRQLVTAGLLEADLQGHGGLRLTEAARPVLRGEQAVWLRTAATPQKKRKDGARRLLAPQPSQQAGPLEEALRALRRRLAEEQDVPAFVVLHDSTLLEIA